MGIFAKDIIGLYLEKEMLQYCCARRGPTGLSLKSPGPEMEAQGVVEGPEYSCLRKFLESISPKARYEFLVTLPRAAFYVRDMSLPPMDLEEAWVSVRNNVSVYCHLPVEEIYYDAFLSPKKDNAINALIFYAPRKDVDRILDIFNETGRRSMLKRVVPFSVAVYSWLTAQNYSLPLKLVLPPQQGSYELGVYTEDGFLYSASWPESAGLSSVQLVSAGLGERMDGVNGGVYFLDQDREDALPSPRSDKLRPLPSIVENRAVAAIAGALSRKRQVSLDGRPTRIKQFKPWYVLVPLGVIVFLALSFLTLRAYKDFSLLSSQVKGAQVEVEGLKKKVAPLEAKLKAMEGSEKFYKGIQSYVEGRPDLYKVINEIARLVPEGTWFSHLLYERGRVTIRGTSGDALQVLKQLRKSKMFGQVKLVGSVSRDRFDDERFRIRIELSKGIGKGK